MRTQHVWLPHTPNRRTNTLTDRDGHNITGDMNQAVPVLSDQNVMMLWIPQIPKWLGLFLTINNSCRQLPNSWLRRNKRKSMICYYTREVMQMKKETGSQMKGMQRRDEGNTGWTWSSQDNDTPRTKDTHRLSVSAFLTQLLARTPFAVFTSGTGMWGQTIKWRLSCGHLLFI